MAIQPDPYFALPSLYGAPAYSRPPRPALLVERPLNADDLPLATQQTEDERRLADALLASCGFASGGAGVGYRLAGDGDPGYRASGNGRHENPLDLLPRRLSLRVITDRIRTLG